MRKSILILIVLTLVPTVLVAQNVPEFPLKSSPDVYCKIHPELAPKAVLLATYVVTITNRPEIIDHNPECRFDHDVYQGVQVVIVTNGYRYTLWVANSGDNGMDDLLSIWKRPNGTHGQESLMTYSDSGLNGFCTSGSMDTRVNTTGELLHCHYNDYHAPDIEGKGMCWKDFFQDEYEEDLDILLAVYQQ